MSVIHRQYVQDIRKNQKDWIALAESATVFVAYIVQKLPSDVLQNRSDLESPLTELER